HLPPTVVMGDCTWSNTLTSGKTKPHYHGAVTWRMTCSWPGRGANSFGFSIPLSAVVRQEWHILFPSSHRGNLPTTSDSASREDMANACLPSMNASDSIYTIDSTDTITWGCPP